MSNSAVVNGKYQKYKNLIELNPNNTLYKRKYEKYTHFMQKGGNLPHQSMSQQQAPNNQQGALSQPSGSKPQTSELIRKIQDIVDYSKQRGVSVAGIENIKGLEGIRGGSRIKADTGSSTKIKGYRDMSGGAIDAALLDRFSKVRPSTVANNVLEVQQNSSKAIIDGVESLGKNKTDLEAKLKALTHQLEESIRNKSDVEASSGALQEEITKLTKEKADLTEAKNTLANQCVMGAGSDAKLKSQIEKLQSETAAQIADLEAQLTAARTEKASVDKEVSVKCADVDSLTAQIKELEKALQNASQTVDGYEKDTNVLQQSVNKYTADMDILKQKLNNFGIEI
jgi:hypothetical protein